MSSVFHFRREAEQITRKITSYTHVDLYQQKKQSRLNVFECEYSFPYGEFLSRDFLNNVEPCVASMSTRKRERGRGIEVCVYQDILLL